MSRTHDLNSMDPASMAAFLQETEQHHAQVPPTAPKHHWSEWYAAFMVARSAGRSAEDAVKEAMAHIENSRRAG